MVLHQLDRVMALDHLAYRNTARLAEQTVTRTPVRTRLCSVSNTELN